MIEFVNEKIITDTIDNSFAGKNTNFLKASHSLW